jgi:endonuclease/exonuclease/phosphatase family metal-dependent hydrolase
MTRDRVRLLLLWIVLLLLPLFQGGGLLPGAPQLAESADGELVVMSYNIMVGRFHEITGEYESFPENLRALAGVMRQSGADLILLQEVDVGAERSGGTDQARFLGEELGFHHSFAAAIEFQGGHYGIALLSRWPIREQRVIPLFQPDYPATHPEWGLTSPAYTEQRVAQVARIDLGGRPVSVINTHLGLSRHQRTIQLAQIAAVITEHLQLPSRAVIMGGDLNCEPDARELEPLRRLLRDAYHQIPDEKGIPRDIRILDRLTFRSDRPATCIDYIFISNKHLEVLATRVLDTTASDHRPVVTRLRLR